MPDRQGVKSHDPWGPITIQKDVYLFYEYYHYTEYYDYPG